MPLHNRIHTVIDVEIPCSIQCWLVARHQPMAMDFTIFAAGMTSFAASMTSAPCCIETILLKDVHCQKTESSR